jgi:hypothetical protein
MFSTVTRPSAERLVFEALPEAAPRALGHRVAPDPSVLARLGVLHGTEAILPARGVLSLGWPELEDALPDRGLPRGVVELAALPRTYGAGASSRARAHELCPESMRGGATSIAIAAIRAVHAADARAWCAWITPSNPELPSLYAPALAQAGVDLARLLVVRPSATALARTLVKVAASGAFVLVVGDVPHARDLAGVRSRSKTNTEGALRDPSATVVRRLALSAEESGTTSLLLTSALEKRPLAWPVAMRLEVERRPDALSLRVTKDRRGHVGTSARVVRLVEPLREVLARAG